MTFNPDAKNFKSNTNTSTDAVKIKCIPQKQKNHSIQGNFLPLRHSETIPPQNECHRIQILFV